MPDIDMDAVKSAKVIQLCPVAEGFYEKKDDEPWENARTVVALALVDLEIESGGQKRNGREVWPVVCGWGEEPDHLRVWTPGGKLIDLHYELAALGDDGETPSIGYLPQPQRPQGGRNGR